MSDRAIAVALAYQVVGPNAHVIRAATMFVVVGTTFFLGGSTKCLLDALKIPCNCPPEEEDTKPTKPAEGAGAVSVACFSLHELLVDDRDDAYDAMHEA